MMAEHFLILSQEVTRWRAYLGLCKPKVVVLIVFTAVARGAGITAHRPFHIQ